MRLNKCLSDAGVCSRREADRWIEQGRVTVDGHTAELGCQVEPGAHVTVDGTEICMADKVYLLMNKPRGIVCTSERREKNNIIDFLGYPGYITYAGRLDKDSEGLVLLTNDGDLNNALMRARNGHEKEYEVTINREITADFIRHMERGVKILDTVTRPCTVRQTGAKCFSIILTQGLNRQIRRMCEALDCRVVTLRRVRILNLTLDGLPSGSTREVSQEELEKLKKMVGISL